MQFQSDVLGVPVERPKVIETTALGAAYLAGLAVGVWKDYSELSKKWVLDNSFTPAMDKEVSDKLYRGWQRAVKHSMHWEEEE